MTSRERVLTAITHREPDRVPYNLRPGPEILEHFFQEFGDQDFADHFSHDIRYISFKLPEKPDGVSAVEWTPIPDKKTFVGLAQVTKDLQERGLAVCGAYQCGVYEQAKHWLGDEEAMVAPYEDPAGFAEILERITDWKSALYGVYARAGADIVWIGDDLGTQRALVMSPALYREWYRPRHQRIIQYLRSIRKDIKIAFHSCGNITPLIPELLELGIDILEAVQAEAVDIAGLKREFGRDLTFWGGVGAQSVLRLPAAKMVEGIRQTLRIMAPGGGYIAAPCHTLTEEVPWENIVAFYEALRIYGAYPYPGKA